jgi:hypothetical protein
MQNTLSGPAASSQPHSSGRPKMIGWFVVLGIALLVLVGWSGLLVQPAPFPSFSGSSAPLETVPLPTNLPAPVARFYRAIYGDQIPLVTSAVITGRATIQPVPGGPRFPARFRFIHEAGQNYRHYIEATWFGLPILRVNESYLSGKSRQEMPWGTINNAPQANQAANLGMWAETLSMPAVLLTDPRVRWEPLDDVTAVLVVPFDEGLERFVVRFDPESHLVRFTEVMRYRDAGERAQKILWITEFIPGQMVNAGGVKLPAVGSATWLDVGKPWAFFTTEEIVLNADVSQSIQSKGP